MVRKSVRKRYLTQSPQRSQSKPLCNIAKRFGNGPHRGTGTSVPGRWEYLDEKMSKPIFSLRYSHRLVAEPLISSVISV